MTSSISRQGALLVPEERGRNERGSVFQWSVIGPPSRPSPKSVLLFGGRGGAVGSGLDTPGFTDYSTIVSRRGACIG